MTRIAMTFTVLAIVAAFSACGGDDNPDPCDETQEECAPPDDGEDADPTPTEEPDAEVSAPDAGPAATPCSAEIMELNGTIWWCGGYENDVLSVWNDETGQCLINTEVFGTVNISAVTIDPDMWGLTTPTGGRCERLQ